MARGLYPDTQPGTWEIAESLGILLEEYKLIRDRLDRLPTFAELGVFSAMFSEHCSYKSSRRFLRRFPTTGKRVLQGPGENAGIVSIGHGWAVAFKMESHNHPSFIEPYQGAATGVGGILRDIFTMGARPIASMNALCFGSPEVESKRTIVRGIVKGIGDYGNCVGVPTVGGQTLFHPAYNLNPLVNAFTLGVIRENRIFRGNASGIGNQVVYVGAKTGRDGVHGARMASAEFSSDKELERPTVQVGDPFTEKLLLEATLEAMDRDLVVGIQDMGAAGLTSSSFEMAYRAKSGLEIALDKVPARESGMQAYELLLSESQERMLLVAEPKHWDALREIFEKWDLHAEIIGTVTNTGRVEMTLLGQKVVDLPVEIVADAPLVERASVVPVDLKQRWFVDRNRMLLAPLADKLERVLSDIHFANPAPLCEQYDSMVGNRTQSSVMEDGAVLSVPELGDTPLRLVLSTDCNPRICWLNPREGGRRAIAEASLNLAVRGAVAIGVTDCLNFGSPENAEVMWQFQECIEGISEACEFFKVPVISGNVSFYNDTDGKPVLPTPMIGMVGILEDKSAAPVGRFLSTEWEIGLIGPLEAGLGGSRAAALWFQRDCGKPDDTDLSMVHRCIGALSKIQQRKRDTVALHDVSDGGLVTAILEMALLSHHESIGVALTAPAAIDLDAFLFGETLPRVVVGYEPSSRTEIEQWVTQAGLSFHVIGSTTDQGKFQILQGRAKLLERDFGAIRASWRDRWKAFF